MSEDRWNDLYDRLTSRKMWFAIAAIAFACWNYHNGELNAVQFQYAVMAAAGFYTVAEGAVDVATVVKGPPAASTSTTTTTTIPVEESPNVPSPDLSRSRSFARREGSTTP
jgi:hypothetical protein